MRRRVRFVCLVAGVILSVVAGACGDGEVDEPATKTVAGALIGDEAGAFTTHVPSAAAPDVGVAVQVIFPARDATRYAEGAPITVVLPGGWDTGSLSGVGRAGGGFVRIEVLLPGGTARDGTASGGVDDWRGAAAVQAVVDVLEYATGTRTDIEGLYLLDRVEYALVDNVGIQGDSHGGNLAIVALAEADPASSPVKWLVAVESPIGDQQALGELNGNPFFEPGTCEGLTCPWPGIGRALTFDSDSDSGGIAGGPSWPGRFSATGDGDSGGTIVFKVVPGPPGPEQKAFVSTELLTDIRANQERLFGADGPPDWLPTEDEAAEFWHWRDGSIRIDDAAANYPDLLVCVVQRQRDHKQTSPDYPHTWMYLEAWSNAGHGFFRLNPDAAYVASISGEDASRYPDNDAGALVPWPEPLPAMLPNDAYVAGLIAAPFEMADRTYEGNRSPNLDTVIHN